MKPIVIPMAPPGPWWEEKLRDSLASLRGLRDLLPDTSIYLCLFCMLPATTAPQRTVLWNVRRWTVELPDGRQLRRPKIPKGKGKLPGCAICESCARVISSVHSPTDPWFMRCSRCSAWILVPSLMWPLEHWHVTCIMEDTTKSVGRLTQGAYLCLSCRRALWDPAKPLPYETPVEHVAGLRGRGVWTRWYKIRVRPEGLPVLYDPGAAHPPVT